MKPPRPIQAALLIAVLVIGVFVAWALRKIGEGWEAIKEAWNTRC